MSYVPGSENFAVRARASAARLPRSEGLNKRVWRAAYAPNDRLPGRTIPRQQQEQWEALQEVFLASRQRFLAMAYTILRNREDAEDAVQDALLSAHKHLRTFEGRSALTTWFTRIVMNASLMIRRKRKPTPTGLFSESSSIGGTSWWNGIPDTQPDPVTLCAEAETLEMVDRLLRRMSPVLREAFRLTYFDEMTNKQAGALLGVKTATFKARLFRARKYLVNRVERSLLVPLGGAAQSASFRNSPDFQVVPSRPAKFGRKEPRADVSPDLRQSPVSGAINGDDAERN